MELPAQATSVMEFVKTIKGEFPETGIILSASNASPDLILSSIRAGAQEFVARPIDEGELDQALDHIKRLSNGNHNSSGRRRGRIINIGSYFGDRVPFSLVGVYAATKAALSATDSFVMAGISRRSPTPSA